MSAWRRTDNACRYGVAVYNFNQDAARCLNLDIGDTVRILEESSEWYKGYALKCRQQNGIFPKAYIQVKEALVTHSGSSEIISSKEPPIAFEITCVLREWGSIWKQLYVEQSLNFKEIQNMMMELIAWRRKIMSRKLSADELKDLQQKVSTKIDKGNALLSLDVVVRDEQGNIFNPETTSTIKLYTQHELAAERIRIDKTSVEVERDVRPSGRHMFNLYVRLRNFLCFIKEDADIIMNLYNAKQGRFLSENYVVHWSRDGVPHDVDKLNNLKVVFTDLGPKDRQLEKVYLVFQVIRIGVMDSKDIEDKKQSKGLRRPFGIAAMDITEIMQGTEERSEDLESPVPFYQCGDKEYMENMIKKVALLRDFNHKEERMWVSMTILQGDLKQVREDYPHLISLNTAVARKMGFPEVIMPGDVRNDIYVTIIQGEFNKDPVKISDRNVEVTMVVCSKKGAVLESVINHGSGGAMMSSFRSVIYYHEDKPKWGETVKVAISTEEEFRGLHLKFLFKHRSSSDAKDKSEKAFAMSFVKLMNKNGTTLEDTQHDLLVYKIESKKEDKTGPYLDLPATKRDLESQGIQQSNSKVPLFSGPYTLSNKDLFQIETFVCSTKLTHNVALLGLLKWQEMLNDTAKLQGHLEQLMMVDGEEIVKFLQDLLDSLFGILMQDSISESHGNLVFDALVYIVSLISDRKYHQFRPVLDDYIVRSFSFATAYDKLMLILKDYVNEANETSHEKSLKRAMKSLEYIFKFIVKSRHHFSQINQDRGKQQFEITLQQLLHAISGMMLYTTDNTLVVQGAALKYMSTTIPDIVTVFDVVELSQLMVEFVNNVPEDRLQRQKMKFIDDLVHSPLFKDPGSRHVLLPIMLDHTKQLMRGHDELEDCVLVLGDIMDTLWSTDRSPHDTELTLIMQVALRTVIQTAINLNHTSKLSGKCVALLMSILRQMTDSHYAAYINNFPTLVDLQDFLAEILLFFGHLIKYNVYPRDWMEMIMLQNSIVLRALRYFANTVKEKFSDPFEPQLWTHFFQCAVCFLTQKPLQLEVFSGSKRQKIVERYKDMRRETGFEIRSMWFNLGPNRKCFIPDMVGLIMEMTLVPETELRKATIPIFFDMMQCEFMQISDDTRKDKGNFDEVENEIITQLDTQVEGGQVDEQYIELMHDILYNLCDGHASMRSQGVEFVERIQELLQQLLEYRHAIQDEMKEYKMSCIVNLLNFYKKIQRQEMYVRYLHKLCDLHLECDNYTEAAYTLLLYVDLLQWSDEPLPAMLKSNKYPDAKTNQELKERLYYDIISYFDKGKMWEVGIKLCKELAQLYEDELFDYERLSTILKRQAEMYDCIMKEMRPDPEYFRVGYYGTGFPSFLQNKLFIFRGKEYERLSDFSARVQMLFPNAMLLKTLGEPGLDVKNCNKQYLQINAVSPVLELQEKFLHKPVSDKILKYYAVNEVQKFTFSRRLQDSGSDLSSMWLERTSLETANPLPGILCWFPVQDTEKVKVSPLENAVETLETSNKRLSGEIEQQISNAGSEVKALGMLLNGVVDPAVNGGIANYKKFYAIDYEGSAQDRELQTKLKDITTRQVALIRKALKIHKTKAPDNLQPLHDHMEQKFAEMCNLMEQEYHLKLQVKETTGLYHTNIRRYPSMPAVSCTRADSMISNQFEQGYATLNHRRPMTVLKDKVSFASPGKGLRFFSKRASQVAADQINESSIRSSIVDPPIELIEQITPKRPMRPEPEKRLSRPPSTQFSPGQLSYLSASSSSLVSNSSSAMTDNSDTEVSDEPPPLPEKSSGADYSNTADIPAVPIRTTASNTLGRKSKPSPPLPVDNDLPPVLPEKPRTAHHNTDFSAV